jgi:hypothetical protein
LLSSVRAPLAAPGSSLEELLADRIGGEVARIAEDRIREAFAVTEFDPDEVYGFMNSEEAAEFLGLPYSSFREIAPSLPRHAKARAAGVGQGTVGVISAQTNVPVIRYLPVVSIECQT